MQAWNRTEQTSANTRITQTDTLRLPHQYSHAPIASCDPGCDCTTRQEDQPLIGLVFFCVLRRVYGGSCGFLWTSAFCAAARNRPVSLSLGRSSLPPLSVEGPKSTSAPNWPSTNQQLIGGPIKRLIRGTGRWREQRCDSQRPRNTGQIASVGPHPAIMHSSQL